MEYGVDCDVSFPIFADSVMTSFDGAGGARGHFA